MNQRVTTLARTLGLGLVLRRGQVALCSPARRSLPTASTDLERVWVARQPAAILTDLRDLFLIRIPESALDDVRLRIIPAGQLLIELEESGHVATCGGWRKYAESGRLEADTGIRVASHTTVYNYLTVALYGVAPFEKALRRAIREEFAFAAHWGLDWAVEVVRSGQGKKPKATASAKRVAASSVRERTSSRRMIDRIKQLEDWCARLLAEQRKIVAAGVWSDRLLRQIEREMGETTFPVVAADERPTETSQGAPLLDPVPERETRDHDPSPVSGLRPIAGAPPGAPAPPWPSLRIKN